MLTEEQKKELDGDIQAIVQKQVEEKLAKEIVRRFTPGGDTPKASEPKFKSFGEFLATIKANPQDARLKALGEGTDSAGGFLVPEEFQARLLRRSIEQSVIRPYATIIPMGTDTLNIPKIQSTTNTAAAGIHGGIIAYWTEEAGAKTPVQPTFGRVKLIAHKLTGFTYASDELLADNAVALDALLIELFGDAIGWYEDEAFIDGNGSGQPLGFMGSGALCIVTRAAAATITMADLGGMMARLYPSSLYGPNTVWIANPSTLPQLMALAATSVTWIALNQGATERTPARLFGMPLLFTEKARALATSGDIALCDLSYYLIGDRSGVAVDRSSEYRFVTDETTWRFVKRVDGQPWVDERFQPKYGSTISPFVVLGTGTGAGN